MIAHICSEAYSSGRVDLSGLILEFFDERDKGRRLYVLPYCEGMNHLGEGAQLWILKVGCGDGLDCCV